MSLRLLLQYLRRFVRTLWNYFTGRVEHGGIRVDDYPAQPTYVFKPDTPLLLGPAASTTAASAQESSPSHINALLCPCCAHGSHAKRNRHDSAIDSRGDGTIAPSVLEEMHHESDSASIDNGSAPPKMEHGENVLSQSSNATCCACGPVCSGSCSPEEKGKTEREAEVLLQEMLGSGEVTVGEAAALRSFVRAVVSESPDQQQREAAVDKAVAGICDVANIDIDDDSHAFGKRSQTAQMCSQVSEAELLDGLRNMHSDVFAGRSQFEDALPPQAATGFGFDVEEMQESEKTKKRGTGGVARKKKARAKKNKKNKKRN